MKQKLFIAVIIALMLATGFTSYQWYSTQQEETEMHERRDLNQVNQFSTVMQIVAHAMEEEDEELFQHTFTVVRDYIGLYDEVSAEIVRREILDALGEIRESLSNGEVEDFDAIAASLEEIGEDAHLVLSEGDGTYTERSRDLLRLYLEALEGEQ